MSAGLTATDDPRPPPPAHKGGKGEEGIRTRTIARPTPSKRSALHTLARTGDRRLTPATILVPSAATGRHFKGSLQAQVSVLCIVLFDRLLDLLQLQLVPRRPPSASFQMYLHNRDRRRVQLRLNLDHLGPGSDRGGWGARPHTRRERGARASLPPHGRPHTLPFSLPRPLPVKQQHPSRARFSLCFCLPTFLARSPTSPRSLHCPSLLTPPPRPPWPARSGSTGRVPWGPH
jgi:hypothetical protein